MAAVHARCRGGKWVIHRQRAGQGTHLWHLKEPPLILPEPSTMRQSPIAMGSSWGLWSKDPGDSLENRGPRVKPEQRPPNRASI